MSPRYFLTRHGLNQLRATARIRPVVTSKRRAETGKFFQKTLIGCVLCTVFAVLADDTRADSKVRPATSFQSELWRMEFREAEKNKDRDSEATQLTHEGVAGGGKRSGETQVGPKSLSTTLVEGQFGSESIPGQAELHDLTEETPFAEWQVDAAAQDTLKKQERAASDWTLSRAASGRNPNGEEMLSQGPSAITFLVAVVAAIVMLGAMFSGRD